MSTVIEDLEIDLCPGVFIHVLLLPWIFIQMKI